MKYLLFCTLTEKYLFSNTIPSDASNFDVIDLEAKKCISGPSGEHDIGTFTEEEEAEAETQEIPLKEEREFDPQEKLDAESSPNTRIED